MKKIISLLFTLLCASLLFAQSEKYTALMEEAKGYEEKKMWVTAAATYADAMSSQPDDCMDAAVRFNEITNAFRKGKPGLDKYTSRMMHDEWKKTLIEFEQYFSTHMARGVKIDEIDGDAHGLKYTISFQLVDSKYTEIKYALSSGYGDVREDSWDDMPYAYSKMASNYLAKYNCWPMQSVSVPQGSVKKTILGDSCYSLVTDHAAYNVKGVAVIGMPMVKDIGSAQISGGALGIFEYRNAFEGNWYDIKFKLVDKEGKTIKTSGRAFCIEKDEFGNDDPGRRCVISGLTGEQFDMLELGEAKIEVDSIYLQYGYVAPSGVMSAWQADGSVYISGADFNKTIKVVKSPMKEIAIPAETCEVTYPGEERSKFKLAQFNCAEKIRKIEAEEERKRQEEEWKNSIY